MEALVKRRVIHTRLRDYWSLIKFRQTALLLITGFSSYLLARGLPFDPHEAIGMTIGLLLSIAGCTALNMLLDRDVDAQMGRTVDRPLAAGRMRPLEAAIFGGTMSVVGLMHCFVLDLRFGIVVALGFVFDLLVYTAWLKRRTPFSIVLGGVSGGMPVLAGRVLALGRGDVTGVLLASSVLLWIPSHFLTLTLRYADDYHRAGVPVWPNVYGRRSTQFFIAVANLLNVLVLMACALLLRVHMAVFVLLLGMSVGMLVLASFQLVAPTDKRNWILFKVASLYMLASSLLLTVGVLI
jgi:protoheme IX farnesyltransferase